MVIPGPVSPFVETTTGGAASTVSCTAPPVGWSRYCTSKRDTRCPCGFVFVVCTHPRLDADADSTLMPATPSKPSSRPPDRRS